MEASLSIGLENDLNYAFLTPNKDGSIDLKLTFLYM